MHSMLIRIIRNLYSESGKWTEYAGMASNLSILYGFNFDIPCKTPYNPNEIHFWMLRLVFLLLHLDSILFIAQFDYDFKISIVQARLSLLFKRHSYKQRRRKNWIEKATFSKIVSINANNNKKHNEGEKNGRKNSSVKRYGVCVIVKCAPKRKKEKGRERKRARRHMIRMK